MDNVPLDTEHQYYWQADSSQAQNFPYYTNSSVSYPPSALPPQTAYNAPPPDYNGFNYSVPPPSYFSVPLPNSSAAYPAGTVTYSSYEYQSHTSVQENKDYYTTSYAHLQSSTHNYNNWDPKCPYQQNSKTDNTQWVAETSSWLSHTAVNSKSQNSSADKAYESVSNGLRRSKSPDSKFHSSKFTSRRKYDDYSNRYGDRNKERRSSRDRFYKRRSRSLDRKSYASNNSYTNHSSARSERSERLERPESRCRSRRRSISRSRSKRRSRSQESYTSLQSSRSTNNVAKRKSLSEREMLLEKYRQNYCATSEDIKRKLNELESDGVLERKIWTRTAPADLYYSRDEKNNKLMKATGKLVQLCDDFKKILIDRASSARELQPPYEAPARKNRARLCRHKSEACSSSSSDSDDSVDEDDRTMEELMAKKQHPQRLHPEMWFNDPGEMNDGPLCRCSAKSRRSGIRHGIYAGEGAIEKCDSHTNNADKLYHYRITISPPTNFLTKTPTIIKHDEHEFIFEGFSMFSHFPLVKLPTCKVIRFNIEYTILYMEEKMPENFTIQELDYFQDYLFNEILELVDFDLQAAQDKKGCAQFHFMPRFVRDLPDNGQEILSMNEVLSYLIKCSTLLIDPDELPKLVEMPQFQWQNFADEVKGMVVTYPGKKPCSVRVDQLDRNQADQPPGVIAYPEIVHFGIRPPQLSYAGNTDYQRAWRDYVKFRHLLANMPKPSFEDKRKLEAKENKLQELRTQSKMKRDVTVDVTSEGFYRTGIMCDIVQHAMLIPVLVCHLRFHKSLDMLEQTLDYKFKNRYLLQLALTHPSYRENFGTNPDHARNSLTNCGIRQPEYGDRRIHYMNTRKRGINTLINIMSRFGAKKETESSIAHNERLEFLGDAVVEFLTSIHLFHMFPDLEEGGLATYRAAIVQNQHLAVLAKKLNLEQYMLYAHGSDLCHDLELRHAMANCFEALMGALFLDGGIRIADTVFGETLFKNESDLLNIWVNYPKHPLQEQEPTGDRQWIPSFELLQKLTKFEEGIGVEFSHIRLLARAFTDRSIGYTNLTLGSNQRLEFLGDTVLQLIVSEYLYKFFPEHHEGHLSLLRSSLVNNKTQAVVCDDLGMTQYALYGNPKAELKTKDRADLLEAFLGALYVDKGLLHCQVFCNVCFFPRLQDFIMNQDWNDPKSKLQQCCLTLRTMDGGEPDIPVYKVIECKGPTNTRVYTVAVYFQGKRLAKASGHSIQEAEMNSAKEALEKSQDLFPQLDHQKRVIAKSMKMQSWSQGGLKFRTIQSSKFDDRNEDRNSVRHEDRRHDSRNEGRRRDNKYEDRQRDNRHSSDSDSDSHRKRRSRSRERVKRSSRSRDRYDSVDRRLRDKPRSTSCSSSNSCHSPGRSVRNKSAERHSSSDDSTSNCTEKVAVARGDENGEDKELKRANRKRRRSSVLSNASSNDASSSNNVSETDKKCPLPFSEKKMKRLE
ncbi:ribonuclease 3 [Nasonia vitripennis]|uniref:Ribonuclease 3 n=1 Tax=Nasonia vitripennis TaxID=7425 RepID=A0A7M7Q1H2_NASVI|nr:ribonuclease 3 [Nasonia vitripennis]